MRRMRLVCIAAVAVIVLVAGACGKDSPTDTGSAADAVRLVVHRNPDCSCCGEWQKVMRGAGMDVVEQHHHDMAAVKTQFHIPADQQSCHTTEVAGYFVEGHVPVDAVRKLLETRPDIDGIALAGMPPGAPGMGGEQLGPLVVTTIVDGVVTGEFARY